MGDAEALWLLRVAREFGCFPHQLLDLPEFEFELMAEFIRICDNEALKHNA